MLFRSGDGRKAVAAPAAAWVAGWAFGLGRCLPATGFRGPDRTDRTASPRSLSGLDPSEQRTRQVRVIIGPSKMLDASSIPPPLSFPMFTRLQLYPAPPAKMQIHQRGTNRINTSVIRPLLSRLDDSFDYRASSATRMVRVVCADDDPTQVLKLNILFFI